MRPFNHKGLYHSLISMVGFGYFMANGCFLVCMAIDVDHTIPAFDPVS